MPVHKLSQRFLVLLEEADSIEGAKQTEISEAFGEIVTIDNNAFLGWRVKARNLLRSSCGENSEHYREFIRTEQPRSYRNNWTMLRQLNSILLAAKEDYDGGYLDGVRSLVQAELFLDELDQARELLKAGYPLPAAVVAGVVLETKLRDLCANSEVPHGKLDKMNADLAKAGVYSLLVQKRITALADIRNSAAHGRAEKFCADDVEDMINQVERFLGDYS